MFVRHVDLGSQTYIAQKQKSDNEIYLAAQLDRATFFGAYKKPTVLSYEVFCMELLNVCATHRIRMYCSDIMRTECIHFKPQSAKCRTRLNLSS